MALDYKSLLFGPIYGVLGVTATITFDDTGTTKDVTVIDKSKGVSLNIDTQGAGLKRTGGADIDTLVPGAVIRMSELSAKAIDKDRLVESLLEMNGSTWQIMSIMPLPTPRGENDGELLLVLELVESASQSEAPSESEVPSESESHTEESETASDAMGEDVVAYLFTQRVPAIQWVINHNLGYKPSVYPTTLGGLEIEASVQHTSDNQCIVSFSAATAGHARLI